MSMALCFVAASIVGAPLNLDDLIKRHEEGLGLIHSIKAQIELRVSDDSGQTWKKIAAYSVLRNGEYERVGDRSYFAASSGYASGRINAAEGYKDYLTTPEGRRTVVYSWTSPEDLPASGAIDAGELASKGQGLSGQIDAPQPFVRSLGYKSDWVNLLLFLPDWRFTLRELCQGTSPRLTKGTNARGEPTYDIDVIDPTRLRRYSLSVDPSHNYLIVRHKQFEVPEVKGKPIEWFNNMTVVDFHEPKKGIFIPKTIRSESESIPGRVYEVAVLDVAVNDPFEDEKLRHLEFPAGIIVVDATQPNTFYLWGDGKPAQTFHSRGEVDAWRMAQRVAYARKARHGSPWVGKFVWIGVATLALVGVFWTRRVVRSRLDSV